MNLPTIEGTPEWVARTAADADCVVDAIFGTGLTRPPRDPFGAVARAVCDANRPVVAVDLPSGLDCDTGEPLGECIRATRTVTFVAEKAGFANPASKEFTGPVTVAPIGCPRKLVDQIAASPAPPRSP